MHLTVDPFTSVPFVLTNCSLCHAERLRWPGGEKLVIGLGNKRIRIHEYDEAFAEAARRGDFNEVRIEELASAAAEERKVPWPAEWRTPLARATVAAFRERATVRADFLTKVKDGPPGRVAVLEAFALAIGSAIHRTIQTAPTVGWAKIPDVVGFPQRVSLSWDGVAEGPMDILIVEADFAAGVRTDWFWAHPLQGASLNAYLRQAREPLPFPGKIDRGLADRGRELFEDNCERCHGSYAADGRSQQYDEQVVPLDVVGTDPARADAATDDFLAGANDERLTRGLVRSARKGGYVPPILTDVWARAPYGHVGQWPSLAVMAMPPDKRPTRIVLDLDAPYDLQQVGIPTRPSDDKPLRPGEYLHDGTRPGLGVGGHPFLADLGKDARAVIEYLKTL
jgi:mono/diheme cytochrome c family protein